MKQGSKRTAIGALALLVVGGVFIWGAAETRDLQDPRLSILLQHFGSFILASIVIALVFQFWQVQGLLEDMWEEAEIVKSLRSARLSRFDLEFEEADVPWAKYFREKGVCP